MESGSPVFVLAWVTSAQHSHHVLGEGASVVFVEHPVRGWEIPGGHLEENETPGTSTSSRIKRRDWSFR